MHTEYYLRPIRIIICEPWWRLARLSLLFSCRPRVFSLAKPGWNCFVTFNDVEHTACCKLLDSRAMAEKTMDQIISYSCCATLEGFWQGLADHCRLLYHMAKHGRWQRQLYLQEKSRLPCDIIWVLSFPSDPSRCGVAPRRLAWALISHHGARVQTHSTSRIHVTRLRCPQVSAES